MKNIGFITTLFIAVSLLTASCSKDNDKPVTPPPVQQEINSLTGTFWEYTEISDYFDENNVPHRYNVLTTVELSVLLHLQRTQRHNVCNIPWQTFNHGPDYTWWRNEGVLWWLYLDGCLYSQKIINPYTPPRRDIEYTLLFLFQFILQKWINITRTLGIQTGCRAQQSCIDIRTIYNFYGIW